jgi:hypothetical protein
MPDDSDSPFPRITPVELREPTPHTAHPDLRPIGPAPSLNVPIPTIERHVMKDPRTTITALVTGLAGTLSYFGILIPESALPIIIVIAITAVGIFAKDGKPVSGGAAA